MTDQPAPLPESKGGGAAALRAPIVACTTGDMGACLMCVKCGHEFLSAIPFTDESEQMDNTVLARKLFYHMCAMGRREERRVRPRVRLT